MHQVDGVAMDPYSIRTTTKMVLIDPDVNEIVAWEDDNGEITI